MIQTEEIFTTAAALPETERSGYLDDACARQPELRGRVEALLRSHEVSGFMEAQTMTAPGHLQPESAGERIGNYKLLEQIGEGAFGVVWVAEQERPVRRRVALKIIKPGMDTKEVIARFEQERQALALMDHPNIARVLDAGATELGRPYFVMELVRGIRITDYCDQAQLPTAARLALFIKVCHAVQHAHQKGIIHRDLKPSNILVTLHDGVPVPKVIDFGVAKATQQQRLTDLTIYTQFEQMIGTPLYMSPEQAEMSGLDIDTRSDIYSLGVLLYELLTGRTPFDPKDLMSQGLDEIRRTIREQEPKKPSTFIQTMAFALRTTVGQHRQLDGAKLAGLIRGDLDWIVMKALEKDRARRYGTAASFAGDIQRHLDNEPILARPPGRLYRVRKLMRRNKATCAAVAAVVAALLAGTAVSIWQAVRANAALSDLRASAPAFAAEAHGLLLQGRCDEALEKINYALKLCPDSADYLVAKGDLLECMLRFSEASAAYRDALRVRPGDARARRNAALCDKLETQRTAGGKLGKGSVNELSAALFAEGRPTIEALPVTRLILEDALEHLKDIPISSGQLLTKPLSARVKLWQGSEYLWLDLENTAVDDLTPLQGLLIRSLRLANCPVSDLRPLRGLPLVSIDLTGTKVADLAPLSEIPNLHSLSVHNSQVTDLWPVRSLPLEWVNLTGTRITDLRPLQNMRLGVLRIGNTLVRDLAPLAGMPIFELWCHSIPATDFSPLAGMPLQSLDARNSSAAELSWLRGLPHTTLTTLLLAGVPAQDFSPLAACTALTGLDLSRTDFADLEVIRGRKLIYLLLNNTRVTDLSPLAGMPLETLQLGNTAVTDLTPLLSCPSLQHLVLPETVRDSAAALKALPKLRDISFSTKTKAAPARSAAEFWEEFLHRAAAPATK